jgi:alpha-tubulin suppressor-like RCC1 family protein
MCPVVVRPASGRRIAAGGTSSCVVEADGRAFCWGLNEVGQLGRPGASETCTTYPIQGNYACSTVPVAVDGGHTWKQIDVGFQFACGLTTGGTAYCWGSNETGQLGSSDALELCGLAPWGNLVPCSRTPLRVATTEQFAWIGTGGRSACALTLDGRAFCWGINGAGAVGSGTLTGPVFAPLPVAGGLRFRQLAVGEEHACGLTVGGDTYCWGNGGSGALGDGFAGFAHRVGSPTAVKGTQRFALVAAGSFHSCALTVDGRPWCWGALAGGALGVDASMVTEPNPTFDARAFRTLTLGVHHSCGLDADSLAWCWGSNDDRALGTLLSEGWGTLRPVPVSIRASFESIDAGWAHTCGIRTGGGIYCWGNNTEGEVGDGTTVMRAFPTRVRGSALAR